MTRGRFRIGVAVAAVAVFLTAIALWWTGGTWENGAMPTNGMITVVAFAGGGLFCLLAAASIERTTRVNPRPSDSPSPCR